VPLDIRGPWPGPIPYDEEHRALFRGRERELIELQARLRRKPLVLLTAFSGVGKTSFLRAGAIPMMRVRRAAALQANRADLQPAVLLLRDWRGSQSSDQNRVFIHALLESIRDLSDVQLIYADRPDIRRAIVQDQKSLEAVSPSDNAYAYVERLSGTVGSLMLVLDQFEEAMQSDSENTKRLLEIILSLCRHSSALSMIISFRQEFIGAFLPLGRDIESLVYNLPQMSTVTLRDALLDSAERGSASIDAQAIDELMAWLNQTPNAQRSASAGSGSMDLLKLQAVLVELYAEAARHDNVGPGVNIDLQTLAAIRSNAIVSGDPDLPSGESVVDYALERFLDIRVLPLPKSLTSTDGLVESLTQADWLALEQRRAAARIAEFFSSGTLKVPQLLAPLLSKAWREEWLILGTTADKVEEAIEANPDSVGRFLNLGYGPLDRNVGVLSGRARGTMSAEDAVDHLLNGSRKALEALMEGNVIRPRLTANGISYELVHDGFGDAFVRWANEKRQTPVDALAAVTAQRGQELNWQRLTGRIENACWRGCWVGPDRPGGNVVIENANFVGCDLRGTLFDRCIFRSGTFEDCDLDFVIFQDCYFEPPFLFDNVRARGLTFTDGGARGLTIRNCSLYKMWWTPPDVKMDALDLEDVVIEGCSLHQWSIDEVRIKGRLTLTDCWIGLSDLLGLSAWAARVDFNACRLIYCPVNEELDAALRRGKRNNRYPADLAPENWQDLALGADEA
jgi:uncharacterized protein YjbI with pentapeptide repeats